MKKVLLTVAIVSATLLMAQKKEIQQAVKAVDGNNNTEALQQIASADSQLQGKMYLLSPDEQEQYYYAKGLALLKSGKTAEGAQTLANIDNLKDNKIYTGKNDQKQRVYFVGKQQADQFGSGLKLKEDSYTPTLTQNIVTVVNPILTATGKEAQDAYNAKDFKTAAQKFLAVTDLFKAVGQPDQLYEYYAAISFALGKDYPDAIKTYKDLIATGYTGVKTTYSALNKKSNQRESFDKTTFELMKKNPDYSDFKEETSPSVEKELYNTLASIMIDSGKADEAIPVLEAGLKKFPGDSDLQGLKVTAYMRSGNTDKMTQTLKEAVAQNPNDKQSWANLGILESKDPATFAAAESDFKKALAIDPNYDQALKGMVFNLYLNSDQDKKEIDQYNTLRRAGKIDDANKIIEGRKQKFAKALPYLETLYKVDPNDPDVVSTLASVYKALGKTDQAAPLEAKLKELKASGKGN